MAQTKGTCGKRKDNTLNEKWKAKRRMSLEKTKKRLDMAHSRLGTDTTKRPHVLVDRRTRCAATMNTRKDTTRNPKHPFPRPRHFEKEGNAWLLANLHRLMSCIHAKNAATWGSASHFRSVAGRTVSVLSPSVIPWSPSQAIAVTAGSTYSQNPYPFDVGEPGSRTRWNDLRGPNALRSSRTWRHIDKEAGCSETLHLLGHVSPVVPMVVDTRKLPQYFLLVQHSSNTPTDFHFPSFNNYQDAHESRDATMGAIT